METYRQLREIPADFGRTVIAIGNFDGVHLGHQFVLARVVERARVLGARAIALTFDPHPARVVHPEQPLKLITPLAAKLELLAKTGIDAAVVLPFTVAFSELAPTTFAKGVLGEALKAVEVHEGDNFRFGRNATAGTTELAQFGLELGFSVVVYTAEQAHGMVVSSSAVRKLIAGGDLRCARWMLGRSFFVDAPQASGRGIGSKLTVPTINLAAYAELLPANGVYVSQLQMGGRCFDAVTNVGNRPTFGEDSFAVESHILDFEPVVMSEDALVRLHFLKRIRGEKRWPTPEALKEQIQKDIQVARRTLRALSVTEVVANRP